MEATYFYHTYLRILKVASGYSMERVSYDLVLSYLEIHGEDNLNTIQLILRYVVELEKVRNEYLREQNEIRKKSEATKNQVKNGLPAHVPHKGSDNG